MDKQALGLKKKTKDNFKTFNWPEIIVCVIIIHTHVLWLDASLYRNKKYKNKLAESLTYLRFLQLNKHSLSVSLFFANFLRVFDLFLSSRFLLIAVIYLNLLCEKNCVLFLVYKHFNVGQKRVEILSIKSQR
jgi:hypothetical protein